MPLRWPAFSLHQFLDAPAGACGCVAMPQTALRCLRSRGAGSVSPRRNGFHGPDTRAEFRVPVPGVVEGRNLPWLIGLDVGVDQMPHVGLIGLQVEAFTAGLADNLPQLQVMVELLPDAGDVGAAVSGSFQFVGDVGVGAYQRGSRLVER